MLWIATVGGWDSDTCRLRIADSEEVDEEAAVIKGAQLDQLVRAALLRSWDPTLMGVIATHKSRGLYGSHRCAVPCAGKSSL